MRNAIGGLIMQTIQELRNTLRLHPQEINSSVYQFADYDANGNIDWEVHLPTRGMNLQRDFVWNLDQKREIIWSILKRRHIARMAVLNTKDDVYQIIDGKQRLSSMIAFINDGFTLLIDGKEYLFSELPKDYQTITSKYMFPYYIVNEGGYEGVVSDQDKIDWFNFINFAGTPQDKAHMEKLQQ
jgi:hypothetical protein